LVGYDIQLARCHGPTVEVWKNFFGPRRGVSTNTEFPGMGCIGNPICSRANRAVDGAFALILSHSGTLDEAGFCSDVIDKM
jgi:hypothetical protein